MNVDTKGALPEIGKSSFRNILIPKSNCANTINKLFSDEEEKVFKLNFNIEESSPTGAAYSHRPQASELSVNLSSSMKGDESSRNKILLPQISKISNCEKNNNLKRGENTFRESNFEQEIKEIDEKISNLRNEKRRHTSSLINMQNEIQNLRVELDFLNNFASYTDNGNLRIEALKRKKKTSEDLENFHKAITQVQKDKDKRDHDIVEIHSRIEQLEINKVGLRQQVNLLKENINNLNDKKDELKNKLILHFHHVLYEGKDTRNEGLIWIVKAVWNLGANVMVSYLPNFLDEELIKFIFNTAEKELELSKLFNVICDNKSKIKSMTIRKSRRTNCVNDQTNLFRTDVKVEKKPIMKKKTENFDVFQIFNRLIEKHLTTEENLHDIKSVDAFLNRKEKLDIDSASMLKAVSSMEAVYDKGKKDLQRMKRSQLDRIAKEFLVANYGRRFNTSLRTVVSAIVGEDNTNSELFRQAKEEKIYFEKVKQNQFFNFLGSNVNRLNQVQNI